MGFSTRITLASPSQSCQVETAPECNLEVAVVQLDRSSKPGPPEFVSYDTYQSVYTSGKVDNDRLPNQTIDTRDKS